MMGYSTFPNALEMVSVIPWILLLKIFLTNLIGSNNC